MTDVANAVFDGADVTMLSGETANGSFPGSAVSTMAAIAQNAELATNYRAVLSAIRDFTVRPFTGGESVSSAACAACLDAGAKLIVCLTASGSAASLVSKYRPSVPVLVVTTDASVSRHTNTGFAQRPLTVEAFGAPAEYVAQAKTLGLVADGDVVACVAGESGGSADESPILTLLSA